MKLKYFRTIVFFLLLFSLSNRGYSQSLDTIHAIVFKAQLMTLSRFGLTTEDKILSTLSGQSTRIICNYKGVTLIWIKCSNTFWQGVSSSVDRLDSCSFIIGYNKRNFTFYRLQGFNCTDAADFFEDLDSQDFISLLEDKSITEIDLLELNTWASKKKNRRKQCQFKSCDDSIETLLSTY